MIRTVEDLIKNLIEVGKSRIDDTAILHRPTIGDMYEGLTKSVLEKAVFEGLNLNIVIGSFIQNKKGELSHEMDAMLIEGEAKQLPFTEKYIVAEDQVIAVFQVKKTLNKSLLSEAYFNLKNVYDICELENSAAYTFRILTDSYKGVFKMGKHSSKPVTNYFQSTTAEHIWHCLRAEACLPLRIVIGYRGYASESGLRDSFKGFLEENRLVSGFSPLHFPNLIMSDQFCLLKGNGMPYISAIENGTWPFYNSSSNKPVLHLLEFIWSRLSYRYELDPQIFGDDLEIECVNRFLNCNIVNIMGQRGWNYHYDDFPGNYFTQPIPPENWEPVSISKEQHHVIAYLCKYGFLKLTKINWCLEIINSKVDVEPFIIELVNTGLVYIDSHKQLALLTDHCRCIALPNIGFVAGDDKTGKLTRWVEKKLGRKMMNTLHIKFDLP